MKKIILVFAILMAFAATSFAYTGGDELLQFKEVGNYQITLDFVGAVGMSYSMGATEPGFISIHLYDSYGNMVLSDSCECDFLGNGDDSSGEYVNRLIGLGGLIINIAVYEILHSDTTGNGIYYTWG